VHPVILDREEKKAAETSSLTTMKVSISIPNSKCSCPAMEDHAVGFGVFSREEKFSHSLVLGHDFLEEKKSRLMVRPLLCFSRAERKT
jgi:hypothetical protein